MIEADVQPRAGGVRIASRPLPRRVEESGGTNPTMHALPLAARAPYAYQPVTTPRQTAWRKAMASAWVRAHLLLDLALLSVAATLLATTPAVAAGVSLLVLALVSLAIGAVALRFIDYASPAGAAFLMLLCDGLAVGTGMLLLGPRLELCALLPGSLLIAALLVDQALTIATGIIGLVGYITIAALMYAGRLHPQIALNHAGMFGLNLGLAVAGMGLLLVAVALATRQLRAAFAHEAAAAYTVRVLDRRVQTKQATIDADAIALQLELAKTLRGGTPRPVKACADLAPLANMINATTERVPGLLRDREERLRLERAVRDLVTALETAWAGFEWTWPAPSGTIVDRLVAILRPQRPQSEAV